MPEKPHPALSAALPERLPSTHTPALPAQACCRRPWWPGLSRSRRQPWATRKLQDTSSPAGCGTGREQGEGELRGVFQVGLTVVSGVFGSRQRTSLGPEIKGLGVWTLGPGERPGVGKQAVI